MPAVTALVPVAVAVTLVNLAEDGDPAFSRPTARSPPLAVAVTWSNDAAEVTFSVKIAYASSAPAPVVMTLRSLTLMCNGPPGDTAAIVAAAATWPLVPHPQVIVVIASPEPS